LENRPPVRKKLPSNNYPPADRISLPSASRSPVARLSG
jgi:hypothetical protein